MMSKKGIKSDKSRMCFKRKIGLAVFTGALLLLAACSSKETVVLEEEDLVFMEGTANASGTETVSVTDDTNVTNATDIQCDTRVEEQPEKQVEQSTLFVHICGEVVNPGVYELPEKSRIYEAVEAAGGFTEEASENYVNLAQVLEDGCKIEIPKLGEEPTKNESGGISTLKESVTEQKDTLVDINTATQAELCSIPGIGESRAASIISYREKNGGFSKIEDIMKVEGIKEGMFEKMKDKICVRGVK